MASESKIKVTEEASLDPEACWRLLERVAASQHLNRAPRLREFLFYVGNRSLKDGITDIHEQEIGSVVFGRQPHYDTNQDNIVRVNATELRKRIDAYFVSDGASEPFRFQIPRGSYMPVFRRLPVAPAPAPQTPTEPENLQTIAEIKPPEPLAPAYPLPARSQLPLVLALTAVAILAIICGLQWRQAQSMRAALHPWQGQPALSAFWSGFLNSHQDTDIILADTSFALVQDITRESYPLRDYLNRSYLGQIQSPDISADRKADLNLIALRNYGSIGDFGVAQRIEALDPTSTKLFVKFARDYTSDQIKQNNAILIGSRRSNPWVDLFSDQMNFVVGYDPLLNQSSVKNLKPRPGEQNEYLAPIDPYASVGYSVIAYLPNPSHTNNTLIIEGTNSQATDAAGEFITSEESMESFRNRIPSKQFSYFEVLLKTTRLNNTPFKAELISYRIY